MSVTYNAPVSEILIGNACINGHFDKSLFVQRADIKCGVEWRAPRTIGEPSFMTTAPTVLAQCTLLQTDGRTPFS